MSWNVKVKMLGASVLMYGILLKVSLEESAMQIYDDNCSSCLHVNGLYYCSLPGETLR